MDPIQCFNDLTTAFISQRWIDAYDHANDLLSWFDHGGYWKNDHLRKLDVIGYCVVIRRVAKNHIERES